MYIRNGRATRAALLSASFLTAVSTLFAGNALAAGALPAGGQYVAGKGSIAGSGAGLTVKQSSTTGIIDWSSFSIGGGNSVTFDNGSGATLNRVTGANISNLSGSLKATGSIYLMNPEGVVIGPGGRVVTGGDFAVTTDIGNNKHGSILDAGHITSQHGSVSLSGANVGVSGMIAVNRGGHIWLTSTNTTSVSGTLNANNASGTGGSIVTTGKTVSVTGTANLSASGKTGGTILIGGDVHGGAVAADNFVKQSVADAITTTVGKGAKISADGSAGVGGDIVVWSNGKTTYQGAISATGKAAGGFAEVSSHDVLAFTGTADLLATNGKTGTLLLDPYNVTISSASTSNGSLNGGSPTNTFTPSGNNSVLNVTTLQNALASANVDVTTGSGGSQTGDITVLSPVTWSENTLTLDAYHSIYIEATMAATGTAGLVLKTNDGGSGGDYYFINGNVTFANTSEALTINGTSFTLVNSIASLANAAAGNSSGDYALANSYDASADGTYSAAPVPIFSGKFEGLGNTISNFSIDDPTESDAVGLFGAVLGSGMLRDITLANVDIVASGNEQDAGGLAGIETTGTIEFASVSGSVSYAGQSGYVGGLVGIVENVLSNSSSSATVSSTNANNYVGGLLGLVRSGGEVLDSYATGAVSGGSSNYVGGLIGVASGGSVLDSYATGAVSGGESSNVGGLAGENDSATLQQSYATGAVSGGIQSTVGGLVGINAGGAVSESYATGAVSANSLSFVGGFAGENTGTIDESYETGLVSAVAPIYVGGFAGAQFGEGALGSTSADYFNVANGSTAVGNGIGYANAVGLTFAEMETAANFAVWTDFGTTPGGSGWVIVDVDGSLNNAGSAAGGTTPMLLSEYSTIVTNAHQLQLMELAPTANYVVANDIDASGTAGGDVWGAQGFIAVGGNNSSSFYTGTFNGNNHTIGNLTIDDSTNVYTGLFGELTGTVENVALANANVTGSVASQDIGALVGYQGPLPGSLIGNVSVSGSVSYTGTSASVGGVAGYAYTAVENSTSAATTSATTTSQSYVGGIVGETNGAALSDDVATGTVNGGSNAFAGGLAGYAVSGSIWDSYASGNVTGTVNTGGLAGESELTTFLNDYASGAVNGGSNGSNAGGLAGEVLSGSISKSYATGAVTTSGSATAGGLVGYDGGANISLSYATGSVTDTVSQSVLGGFVGYSSAAITQSYSTGAVSEASNPSDIGGFAGENYGTIDESYETGAVTGGNTTVGGGFVGYNNNTIGATTPVYYNDTANTGGAAGSGGSPLSSGGGLAYSAMQTASNFSGWSDFGMTPGGAAGQVWVIVDVDGSLNNAGSAAGGTTPMLLSEYSTTVTNAHQLQLMELAPTANYTLANNIDASGTESGDVWAAQGFIPVGGNNSSGSYSGTFNGAGYVINGLYINDSTNGDTGLFGETTGTVENVGLTNVNITGGAANANVGALAGFGSGSGAVTNVYSTGTVTGTDNVGGLVGGTGDNVALSDTHSSADVSVTATGWDAGGLVGSNGSAVPISQSYATGNVEGGVSARAGGLVGANTDGSISQSYATGNVQAGSDAEAGGLVGANNDSGSISQSYATGNVEGGSIAQVGGLVGYNNNTINDSYATGDVTGSSSTDVGGLIGQNDFEGIVTNAYSIGTASGGTNVGGSVGVNESGGVFTEVYWATDTSGIPTIGVGSGSSANVAGETTATLQTALPSNFSNTTWGIVANASYPYFLWQYPSAPAAISGKAENALASTVSGETVSLLIDGVASGSTTTYANGFFYFLLPAVQSSGALVYASGTNGAAFADGGGSATGLFVQTNVFSETTAASAYSAVASDVATTVGSDSSVASILAGLDSQTVGSSATTFTVDTAITGSSLSLDVKNLIIDAPIDVSSLAISAGQTVTQDNTGTITATNLVGSSGGAVTLNSANDVTDLEAVSNSLTDASFSLTNNAALKVTGAVDVGSGTLTLSTTGAGHGLAVDGAMTGGTVDLVSAAAVSETGAGAIDATKLVGSSVGGASLTGANDVTDLEGFTNTVGGGFSLTNAGTLTVASEVDSIGNVTLMTTGAGHSLALDALVDATNEATLTSAGTITETGSGAIDAFELSGSSVGGATLTEANDISDLESFTNASSGSFKLTDAGAMSVMGPVSSTGNVALTTTGAGHGLTIRNSVTATNEAIMTSAGMLGEVGGAIHALELAGSSVGGATLNGANDVTDLEGFTNATSGNFALTDAASLTIAQALGSTGTVTLKTTGAGHKVGIDNAITAAGEATLTSASTIAEASGGTVHAATLTGSADGIVSLLDANVLTDLAAFTTSGGNFSIVDNHALTTTGTVNSGAGTLAVTTGSGDSLTIGSELTGSSEVTLTSGGALSETGAGVIDAPKLAGSSIGGATLAGANDVTDLESFTNSTSGSFKLTNAGALTVAGHLSSTGNVTLTTTGAGHGLAIANTVTAANEATLISAATLTETGSGAIDAVELTGSSVGGATLAGANDLTDLEGFTNATSGSFKLTDGAALTVMAPLSSTGDVTLTTTGAGHGLSLHNTVTAGNEVTLASAGTLGESGGAIDAVALAASSDGVASLMGANDVSDLEAVTTLGGNFSFVDDHALTTLGTVNSGAGTLDITTDAGDGLAIDSTVETTGTMSLVTGGEATESNSTGAIKAATLNVTAQTGIDLASTHNSITHVGTHTTTSGPNVINQN